MDQFCVNCVKKLSFRNIEVKNKQIINFNEIKDGIIIIHDQSNKSKLVLDIINKCIKCTFGNNVMLYDISNDERLDNKNIPYIIQYKDGKINNVDYHVSDYHIMNLLCA